MAFQFASTAFLALGLAAPLLVLAYTRKQTRNARRVSSVLLLRRLPKHSVIRKRVKLPLNFFFELLALLALAAAAAYPLYTSSGSRTAIILDNTLSMSARSGSSGTVFADAVKRLLNWIDDQPSANSYTLFTSSPVLQRSGRPGVSSGTIAAYLAGAAPTLSSDSITSAIEQLGESGAFDQIIVVSDRSLTTSDEPLTEPETTGRATSVRGVTVGSGEANVFLSAIAVRSSGMKQSERSVSARVAQSGGTLRDVEIKLFGAAGGSADYSLLSSSRIQLNPDSSREVELAVPADERGLRSFRVELQPEGPDALALDNTAWTSVDAAGEAAVLLVSPLSGGEDALGLKKIPGIRVAQVSPAEYASLPLPRIRRFSLVVFHRTAPVAVPPIATLLVLPPPDNALFPVRADIEKPKISSWDAAHPLTTYLRVALLEPGAASVFAVPLWARSIINVEQGSILASGESRGVRFAALGFEIFPFEGSLTPAASVLTLNLIRWLSGSSELSYGCRTGSRYELQGNASWVIANPSGTIETIETTQSAPGSVLLDAPGLYTVTRISGASSDTLSRSTDTLAVNVFYPQESATASPPPIAAPDKIAHQEIAEEAASPVWPQMIGLALLLLLIEFGIRAFQARKSAGGAAA